MAYDREEDILYLAHQLWEEQEASSPSARICWQDAAAQVLSGGRARSAYQDEPRHADVKLRHAQTCLQFGASCVIEPGKGATAYRITMITHSSAVEIANPAIFLVATTDQI